MAREIEILIVMYVTIRLILREGDMTDIIRLTFQRLLFHCIADVMNILSCTNTILCWFNLLTDMHEDIIKNKNCLQTYWLTGTLSTEIIYELQFHSDLVLIQLHCIIIKTEDSLQILKSIKQIRRVIIFDKYMSNVRSQ